MKQQLSDLRLCQRLPKLTGGGGELLWEEPAPIKAATTAAPPNTYKAVFPFDPATHATA